MNSTVLRYATDNLPGSLLAKGVDWFLKRVEERTEGQVQFKTFWSESLAPAKQLLDVLNRGLAEISFIMPHYTPDQTPLLTIQTLPTIYEDGSISGMAIRDLINENGAVNRELRQWNARYLTSIPLPQYMPLTRHPVTSLEDLKGVQIRALGAHVPMIQQLGGVPVRITTHEVMGALQQKILDGILAPPIIIADFGFHRELKNYWLAPFGNVCSFLAISQKTWNRLPADMQRIFDEVSMEHAPAYHRIVLVEGQEAALAKMRAQGAVVREAPMEAKARIAKLAEPVWENWIREMENRGLPGQQVAETYRKLLAKHARTVSPSC